MRLVIHRTYKCVVIAEVTATLDTPLEYIAYLRKFNVEIDMQDAVKDIVVGDEITLTLPIEMDYSLSHDV